MFIIIKGFKTVSRYLYTFFLGGEGGGGRRRGGGEDDYL